MNQHAGVNHAVSVIGLGAMGTGIAQTLLEAGCQVSVWNRSRGKVDALVSRGAVACDSPLDAVKMVFEEAEKRGLGKKDLAALSEVFAP